MTEISRNEGRLTALRQVLRDRRVDGFVVPRADEFQGEMVPPGSERLAWLTGFTGSAGIAVILADRAVLFVDGRYTLQARTQVDPALYEIRHLTDEPPEDWLAANLPKKARLGFDPWLHTPNQAARLRRGGLRAGAELVALEDNPIDFLWTDRPAPPASPVVPHAIGFAGEPAADKRARLAAALSANGVDAAFLGAPDSVAWLLNLRGNDVPFTPLALTFAVLNADASVELIVDEGRLPDETRRHLGDGVRVRRPADLGSVLDGLGTKGKRVQVDRDAAPAWVWHRLKQAGAEIVEDADPCALPKARKNTTEIQGFRNAHLRDGVAMVRFLVWFAEAAPAGGLTERDAIDRLEAFRAASDMYRGPSFETIAGAGPNGAIVHYRCTPESNRAIERGTLFLLDSGGQYLDGTTDVTRTLAVGEPEARMRRHFTLVLKGHIALARARFPAGTTGPRLDAIARQPLWDAGLDFDHGTGHGIGSYLGVHEGPARINKSTNNIPLEPGMVFSDEPGFYLAGAYGIRIENLIAVERLENQGDGGRAFLGFETLTLVPIDLSLVDAALLTADEAAWLDAYHARVRDLLSPHVEGRDAAWLAAATRPLA